MPDPRADLPDVPEAARETVRKVILRQVHYVPLTAADALVHGIVAALVEQGWTPPDTEAK